MKSAPFGEKQERQRERKRTGESDFELTSKTEERSENTLKFTRGLESSSEASLL